MPDLTVWPTDGADGSVSSEARWRKMARLWIPSGVKDPAALAPTLAAGPTINVTTGGAWLDGHYAELTTPASIPATANGILVVRLTVGDNRAELLYRDGVSVPTQTDATWELVIAGMSAGTMTDRRPIMSLATELSVVPTAGIAVSALWPAGSAVPGTNLGLWATGLYLATASFDVNVTTISATTKVYGVITGGGSGVDLPLAGSIPYRTMLQMTAVGRLAQIITMPVRCTTAGTGWLYLAASKSAAAGVAYIENDTIATWLHVHRIGA
jgi:hypothetical protein